MSGSPVSVSLQTSILHLWSSLNLPTFDLVEKSVDMQAHALSRVSEPSTSGRTDFAYKQYPQCRPKQPQVSSNRPKRQIGKTTRGKICQALSTSEGTSRTYTYNMGQVPALRISTCSPSDGHKWLIDFVLSCSGSAVWRCVWKVDSWWAGQERGAFLQSRADCSNYRSIQVSLSAMSMGDRIAVRPFPFYLLLLYFGGTIPYSWQSGFWARGSGSPILISWHQMHV